MGRAILEVYMETQADPMSFGLGDSVSDDHLWRDSTSKGLVKTMV